MAVVSFEDGVAPAIEVVHRYPHQPVVHGDGTLRWDWARLMEEVELGLEVALARGPLASIGVDTWGVDYGLLDGSGVLVAPPFSYRDPRTDGWRDIAARLGEQRLYETTGVQLMGINTVFQLAVHDRHELTSATTLLMLPELVVHHLTGAVTAETTSVGTAALVSLATNTWDDGLLRDIDVPASLFPPIAMSGTAVGHWRGVPVHLVGGHDTASAVAARPGSSEASRAFVSTGTWVLVGVESDTSIVTDAARAANFSNERSVDGRYRILRNVTGLWLLEQCRVAWGNPPMADLVALAAACPRGPVVDPGDARFVTDTPAAIASVAGLSVDDRGALTRCILDSIAAAVARVIDDLVAVTGIPITALDVFGGGAEIPFLVDLIAGATGLPITLGSPEATALGNARQQYEALCSGSGGM